MRNIKLVIEYDGGAYAGWQRQAGDPTVQAALEDALATLLRAPVTVTGAGRTDAGVHARAQVANFHTASEIDPPRIARGLNALLPRDIAVLACEEAPVSFHARFDAVARRYVYTISSSPTALDRRYVWHVRFALDAGPMREAAESILGTHDFTSFCRTGADVRHHVCTVREAVWTVVRGPDPFRDHRGPFPPRDGARAGRLDGRRRARVPGRRLVPRDPRHAGPPRGRTRGPGARPGPRPVYY